MGSQGEAARQEWRELPEFEKEAWQEEANFQQQQRDKLLLTPLKAAAELAHAELPRQEAHFFTHGYSDDQGLKTFCHKASFQRLQLNFSNLENAVFFDLQLGLAGLPFCAAERTH